MLGRVDHGDHVVITKSRMDNAGGVIMLGRSDGVLYVLRSFRAVIPPSIPSLSLRNAGYCDL